MFGEEREWKIRPREREREKDTSETLSKNSPKNKRILEP